MLWPPPKLPPRWQLLLASLVLNYWLSSSTQAQEPASERVIVESRLLPTDADESGFDVTNTGPRRAARTPPPCGWTTPCGKQIPGFSLFRRSSSQVANPTTQGVSLRNIGPNGAGRTLVLLDGIPQNDPFGGWVYWSRLPPSGLDHVDVLQGGGAGSFGNAALGGTIALYSQQLAGNSLAVDTTGGSRGTYEVSAAGQRSHCGRERRRVRPRGPFFHRWLPASSAPTSAGRSMWPPTPRTRCSTPVCASRSTTPTC